MIAPAWTALEISSGAFADTFAFPVSHQMGLPPGEVARLVYAAIRGLAEWRPRIALWVPVVGAPSPEAEWFRQAIYKRLWGVVTKPYAVTDGRRPQLRDFSYPPARSHSTAAALPAEAPRILTYTPRQQQALLVLARLRTATTAEVAAHLVLSNRQALRLLNALADDDCLERTTQEETKYDAWSITRRGVLIARRGWGIPPGVTFAGGRERTNSSNRHRRTARLWPNWLRDAYPDAEIWAGWSEPRGLSTGGHQADALAWGSYRGHETVFWLEVESGKRSRAELRRNMEYRLTEITMKYAGYQVVIGMLSMPWAARAVLPVLTEISPHVAVVLEDWKNVGSLPRPAFGEVTVSNAIKK